MVTEGHLPYVPVERARDSWSDMTRHACQSTSLVVTGTRELSCLFLLDCHHSKHALEMLGFGEDDWIDVSLPSLPLSLAPIPPTPQHQPLACHTSVYLAHPPSIWPPMQELTSHVMKTILQIVM